MSRGITITATALLVSMGIYFGMPIVRPVTYSSASKIATSTLLKGDANASDDATVDPNSATSSPLNNIAASHIPTPAPLKALYLTSWVAGTPSLRAHVVDLLDRTEANAVVIDIKDATGKISFAINDPDLKAVGSQENRIRDLRDFIQMLHQKNIYVIGRIATFQDPYFAKLHPEYAVKRASDGAVWKDHKGISWLDAGSQPVWDYVISIAKESYNAGFDELNFDYVRFPSDGNMKDIAYPYSGMKEKSEVIKSFFQYLSAHLKDTGAVLSADLFGLTTTAPDDLGIGQVLTKALPYFDYIDPMVYPSHYASGFENFKNPADHPYEVVKAAMDGAVGKIAAASTTPQFRGGTISKDQIRPWLQDFNLGATYTAEMVRAQIKATYDAGMTSWLIWDPNNKYTQGALLSQ